MDARRILMAAIAILAFGTGASAQKAPSKSMAGVEAYPTYSAALDSRSIKSWIDTHLEGWGTLVFWDDHFAGFLLPDGLDISHPPFVKAALRIETTSQPMAELVHSRSSIVFAEVNCSERTSRTTAHILFPGNNMAGEPRKEDNPNPEWEPFSAPQSLMGVTEESLCRP